MKITKRQLRKLVHEAVQNFLNENTGYYHLIQPGEYLEVVVPSDGHDVSVEPIDPRSYQNKKSYAYAFKALVKVEQIAETVEEY